MKEIINGEIRMLDLEDNPTKIGNYVFSRHEGDLYVAPYNYTLSKGYGMGEIYHPELGVVPVLEYYPVDYFSDLIDALTYFKERGLEVKLTGEEFKQLIEGSITRGYCGSIDADCPVVEEGEDPCDKCKHYVRLNDWVSFNRYDFIKDYGAFRRLVLIRDDYKCLCCGNDNEKDLQVHHIRSFKDNLELATSVKNGVTLCKDCHKKYHKRYGWNGKQETFSKFIREMLD